MIDEICRSLARENPILARPCLAVNAPQTNNCVECYEWANTIYQQVKDHRTYSICSRDCNDYDDQCWIKCEEKLNHSEKFFLEVLEEVYYVIAPEEKPECIKCLQLWNPGW